MAPLALVPKFATRLRCLHCFQSWPPGCITALPHCLELPYWHYQLVLSWYLHQPSTLANFQTLPWIALLAFSVSIELVSSSARFTSVKSYKRLGVSDGHPDPKVGPQVYLGPIKTKGKQFWKDIVNISMKLIQYFKCFASMKFTI